MENQQEISVEEFLSDAQPGAYEAPSASVEDNRLRAVIEALVYVSDEPLTPAQIAGAVQQPVEKIREILDQLVVEFDRPEHGVSIREVAGGFKMATKAEHHDSVREFVKNLNPPMKLSLPALETLAVIAYKQPVTSPEVMEIRGVQGAGVLKTLLDRKLIAAAGRKNVVGKPILYKTTKEFLVQFGLKDLTELPSLKEFEEIRRFAFSDGSAADEAGVAEEAASHGVPTEPMPPEPGPDQPIPAEPTPEEPPEPVAEQES
jgi:segregation and condensation protein B